MGRVEENKLQKKNSLMDVAFHLFSSKGIAKTSISDIAEQAGIAKGTFYLYFRDKYDLQEKLIAHKSEQLFQHALTCSGYETKTIPADKLLAIVDDILLQLQKNPHVLRFISKNLSWGLFRRAMTKSDTDYLALFAQILDTGTVDEKTLELELYTIFELVGSTCYDVILEGDPIDMEGYTPYLHRCIRAVLASFIPA